MQSWICLLWCLNWIKKRKTSWDCHWILHIEVCLGHHSLWELISNSHGTCYRNWLCSVLWELCHQDFVWGVSRIKGRKLNITKIQEYPAMHQPKPLLPMAAYPVVCKNIHLIWGINTSEDRSTGVTRLPDRSRLWFGLPQNLCMLEVHR